MHTFSKYPCNGSSPNKIEHRLEAKYKISKTFVIHNWQWIIMRYYHPFQLLFGSSWSKVKLPKVTVPSLFILLAPKSCWLALALNQVPKCILRDVVPFLLTACNSDLQWWRLAQSFSSFVNLVNSFHTVELSFHFRFLEDEFGLEIWFGNDVKLLSELPICTWSKIAEYTCVIASRVGVLASLMPLSSFWLTTPLDCVILQSETWSITKFLTYTTEQQKEDKLRRGNLWQLIKFCKNIPCPYNLANKINKMKWKK